MWYTTTSSLLSLPSAGLKSVIADNILYLLGGLDKDGMSPAVNTAPLGILSSYELIWSSLQDTPWCRSAPISMQGHLLTIGGEKKTRAHYMYTRNIHLFNSDSHCWEVIGEIPSAKSGPSAASVTNNKIIVVGGYSDKGQYTNDVWIGTCEPQ